MKNHLLPTLQEWQQFDTFATALQVTGWKPTQKADGPDARSWAFSRDADCLWLVFDDMLGGSLKSEDEAVNLETVAAQIEAVLGRGNHHPSANPIQSHSWTNKMKDIDEIISKTGPRVREAVSNFLIPLQTTRVVSRKAFEELDDAVKILATQLKGHELVPKSLLNEVYGTMQARRNEAPYFEGETTTHQDMANQLEMTLGLILIGESHEDRVPGSPRVV